MHAASCACYCSPKMCINYSTARSWIPEKCFRLLFVSLFYSKYFYHRLCDTRFGISSLISSHGFLTENLKKNIYIYLWNSCVIYNADSLWISARYYTMLFIIRWLGILYCLPVYYISDVVFFYFASGFQFVLPWKTWRDLTVHLTNKTSKGTFFFEVCMWERVGCVCVFVAGTHTRPPPFTDTHLNVHAFVLARVPLFSWLNSLCKTAPWLQSKFMQSKRETTTVGKEGGRDWGGWRETDGGEDSPSGRDKTSPWQRLDVSEQPTMTEIGPKQPRISVDGVGLVL